MTEPTTTADKLAAWQLIEEHRLCACPMSDADGFNVFQSHVGASAGIGTTLADAVKDWAERAGVPWQPPQVENRWTFRTEGGGIASAYTSPELAAAVMEREGYGETAAANYVVPCEVVIRESEGV